MAHLSDNHAALPLSSAPAAIRTADFVPIEDRLIRGCAINGVFPSQQRHGIWHFYCDDTERIIQALKLTPVARAPQTVAA